MITSFPSSSYSIDFLVARIFENELNNYLKNLPEDQIDEEVITVIEYLEKRISHIKKNLK